MGCVSKGSECSRYQKRTINGHIDVAEVGDELAWTVPIFELTTREGYLFGRGKCSVAATLYVIKLLKELNIEIKGNLQIQTVIGEEAGTLPCIERGYTADFELVVDGSERQIHGQEGVITGWITIKSKKSFPRCCMQEDL